MAVELVESEPALATTFRQDLERIAKLEEEHDFLGVRFSLREGVRGEVICAEELTAHVLFILEQTIDLSENWQDISLVAAYPDAV